MSSTRASSTPSSPSPWATRTRGGSRHSGRERPASRSARRWRSTARSAAARALAARPVTRTSAITSPTCPGLGGGWASTGDLDPVRAAPLTDAAVTPYRAIRRSQRVLTPGSVVTVIGVGGLGHLAVQILRAVSPATVVAVDPRPEARVLATSLGAHHVVEPGPDAA